MLDSRTRPGKPLAWSVGSHRRAQRPTLATIPATSGSSPWGRLCTRPPVQVRSTRTRQRRAIFTFGFHTDHCPAAPTRCARSRTEAKRPSLRQRRMFDRSRARGFDSAGYSRCAGAAQKPPRDRFGTTLHGEIPTTYLLPPSTPRLMSWTTGCRRWRHGSLRCSWWCSSRLSVSSSGSEPQDAVFGAVSRFPFGNAANSAGVAHIQEGDAAVSVTDSVILSLVVLAAALLYRFFGGKPFRKRK